MVDIRKATFKKQNDKLAIRCPDCGGIPETLHMDSDYLLECLNCHQTLITLISYSTPEELSAKLKEVLETLSNA
jgi:ribosomal protein S27E